MHNAKVPHDDRCRDRIDELMASDDDQRQVEQMTSRTAVEVENEISCPETGEEMDVGEPSVQPRSVHEEDQPRPETQSVSRPGEEQPIPTVRVGGSSSSGTRSRVGSCNCDGDLKRMCHGDNFCVVARQKQLQPFGKILEKMFEVKQTGHIQFGANKGKELKILIRTIRIDVLNDEMTLEADKKLVESALESMKLNGAKSVDSPRVRRTVKQTTQIENSEKLTSAESTLHRSLVMKLTHVAQDRIDSEVFHKTHEKATEWTHARTLKRLGRHLVKNRRCMLTCAPQKSNATLQVHVDSDWAGDLLGRKRMTGVIVRRGKHLLRHMSWLQTLVALSSGEAEYFALIRGACTSLGIQSHHQDWMIDVPTQIYSDSSAARSAA